MIAPSSSVGEMGLATGSTIALSSCFFTLQTHGKRRSQRLSSCSRAASSCVGNAVPRVVVTTGRLHAARPCSPVALSRLDPANPGPPAFLILTVRCPHFHLHALTSAVCSHLHCARNCSPSARPCRRRCRPASPLSLESWSSGCQLLAPAPDPPPRRLALLHPASNP